MKRQLISAITVAMLFARATCASYVYNPFTHKLDYTDGLIIGTSYTSGHTGGTTYAAAEQCRDDTYTITTDFQQAAQTGAAAIATLAAFGDVRTVRIIENTTVAASNGTVTAVAACIGTSGTPCGYGGPFPLMGASSPTFKSYTASGTLAATDNGTQALQLQLTVTGGAGNLAILNGGVVKTRVCAVIGQ